MHQTIGQTDYRVRGPIEPVIPIVRCIIKCDPSDDATGKMASRVGDWRQRRASSAAVPTDVASSSLSSDV